jgi:hypothetical protein
MFTNNIYFSFKAIKELSTKYLFTEKDNLNKDQKQELVNTIDFKLVTEETLQKDTI